MIASYHLIPFSSRKCCVWPSFSASTRLQQAADVLSTPRQPSPRLRCLRSQQSLAFTSAFVGVPLTDNTTRKNHELISGLLDRSVSRCRLTLCNWQKAHAVTTPEHRPPIVSKEKDPCYRSRSGWGFQDACWFNRERLFSMYLEAQGQGIRVWPGAALRKGN